MTVYCSLDGDDVGNILEGFMIRGQADLAAGLSQNVRLALSNVASDIEASGGKVIFFGGDNLLAEGKFDALFCEHLLRRFAEAAIYRTEQEKVKRCTASCGLGKTITEAYLALKLAKSAGKGVVVDYSEALSGSRD